MVWLLPHENKKKSTNIPSKHEVLTKPHCYFISCCVGDVHPIFGQQSLHILSFLKGNTYYDQNAKNTFFLLSLPIFQAALLNSFPAIFDELLQMFTVQEVAEFVRGTLGSMPSTVHIGQSMDVVKLQSIARTVDSRLFSFPGIS